MMRQTGWIGSGFVLRKSKNYLQFLGQAGFPATFFTLHMQCLLPYACPKPIVW